jgi:hypothetical protein
MRLCVCVCVRAYSFANTCRYACVCVCVCVCVCMRAHASVQADGAVMDQPAPPKDVEGGGHDVLVSFICGARVAPALPLPRWWLVC